MLAHTNSNVSDKEGAPRCFKGFPQRTLAIVTNQYKIENCLLICIHEDPFCSYVNVRFRLISNKHQHQHVEGLG